MDFWPTVGKPAKKASNEFSPTLRQGSKLKDRRKPLFGDLMKHNNCQLDHIIYQSKGRSKSYCPHFDDLSANKFDEKFVELSLFFSNSMRNRQERGNRVV